MASSIGSDLKEKKANYISDQIVVLHHGTTMGGAEKSLYELFESMHSSQQFYPLFIVPQGELYQKLAQIFEVKEFAFQRFEKKNLLCLPFKIGILSIKLWWTLRKKAIKAVYINSIHCLLCCTLLKWVSGYKIIFHCRDDLSAKNWQLRIMYMLSDKIIFISEFLKKNHDKKWKGNEGVVIQNGIDLSKINICWNSQYKTIGYAGQFIPWKNLNLLIEGVEILNKNKVQYNLVLAGVGDLGDPIYEKEIIEKESRTVQIKSWYEDINDFFNVIDVLVLPSVREPFGRIVVEAMAAQVPVLGLDSGAIPELISHGKNGLLFKNNANDLAEKLIEFASCSKMRERVVQNAYQQVKKYDICVTGQRVFLEINDAVS